MQGACEGFHCPVLTISCFIAPLWCNGAGSKRLYHSGVVTVVTCKSHAADALNTEQGKQGRACLAGLQLTLLVGHVLLQQLVLLGHLLALAVHLLQLVPQQRLLLCLRLQLCTQQE